MLKAIIFTTLLVIAIASETSVVGDGDTNSAVTPDTQHQPITSGDEGTHKRPHHNRRTHVRHGEPASKPSRDHGEGSLQPETELQENLLSGEASNRSHHRPHHRRRLHDDHTVGERDQATTVNGSNTGSHRRSHHHRRLHGRHHAAEVQDTVAEESNTNGHASNEKETHRRPHRLHHQRRHHGHRNAEENISNNKETDVKDQPTTEHQEDAHRLQARRRRHSRRSISSANTKYHPEYTKHLLAPPSRKSGHSIRHSGNQRPTR